MSADDWDPWGAALSGDPPEPEEPEWAPEYLPWWIIESPRWHPDDAVPVLGRHFVGKKEPVPIRPKGRTWHAEKRRLNQDDFNRHLAGKHLLGAYLLDNESRSGVAVLDLDTEGEFRDALLGDPVDLVAVCILAQIASSLAHSFAFAFGRPGFVTLTGGKGAHIIFTLPERADAWIIRRQMRWVCAQRGLKRKGQQWGNSSERWFVECFPKQDEVGDGLGNLIRLPYGRDPGTGRWSCVVLDPRMPTPYDPPTPEGLGGLHDGACWQYETRCWLESTLIDKWGDMAWVSEWLGRRGVGEEGIGITGRCADLLETVAGLQIVSAVAQVIATAGCYDVILARGLLSELERGPTGE